ncbi:MAG TPA: hypothetical protein VEP90_16300, partial [Methylomirabilota bacterium]|nr:hypothetical protein [Methylomirabilota bacterium]
SPLLPFQESMDRRFIYFIPTLFSKARSNLRTDVPSSQRISIFSLATLRALFPVALIYNYLFSA